MSTNHPPGETSLPALLRTLRPHLSPETFIYATIPLSKPPQSLPPTLQIQLLFREAEAWTLITTKESGIAHSNQGLQIEGVESFECRMITLTVQSSLEAVGLTAAVSRCLTERGVACNVVAGFLHDHLFVPVGAEGEAMEALGGLVREAVGDEDE